MTSLGIQQRPTVHRHIGRSPLLLSHKQRSSSSLPLLKRLHHARGVYPVSVPQKDPPSLDDYFSLLQRLKEETYMYKQNKELKHVQSRRPPPRCKQQPHSPPPPSPLPRGPSSRVPPLPRVPSNSRVIPLGRPHRRLSQHSSHKMASSSSSQKGKHTPAVIKGHRHLSYGGAVPPENITVQQFYDLTPTKKSNVRLNDQLIPKPTDINIAELMIKVPIPKEHPYQAHISRFALFPTFRSPDDPDTGVRAASLRPLNPLVPASAPEVIVLRKTKGGPHRHEVLETPMTTRKKTISWPGHHGFLDHPEAQTQAFYPNAQKTVFPNPTLRDWDVTLSEPTANMLRNVEKSHWVTSYQLHYTGTGPTNPLRLDDFHENTIDMITGKMTPYTTQLRERSYPVLVPAKPRDGRKARIRQGRRTVESTYHPPVTAPAAESLNADQTYTQNHPAMPLGTMSGHHGHQGIQGNHSPQDGHSELSLARPAAVDVSEPEPAQVSGYVFPGHHLQDQGSRCERCGEERCECQVTEAREGLHHPGPGASDPQQSSQAPRASLEKGAVEKVTDTESSLALCSRQLSHPPLNETTKVTKENNPQSEVCYEDVPSSKKQSYTASGGNPFSLSHPASALATNNTGAAYESETAADLVSPNIRNWRNESTANQTLEEQDQEWQNREIPIPRSISNPCIQPRPHALPSTHPGERGRGRCQLALLELQDSFSKSEVHRLFHSSLQGGTVNLQDNVHTGRKHRFYGFNSYYFHN